VFDRLSSVRVVRSPAPVAMAGRERSPSPTLPLPLRLGPRVAWNAAPDIGGVGLTARQAALAAAATEQGPERGRQNEGSEAVAAEPAAPTPDIAPFPAAADVEPPRSASPTEDWEDLADEGAVLPPAPTLAALHLAEEAADDGEWQGSRSLARNGGAGTVWDIGYAGEERDLDEVPVGHWLCKGSTGAPLVEPQTCMTLWGEGQKASIGDLENLKNHMPANGWRQERGRGSYVVVAAVWSTCLWHAALP